MKLKKIFAGMAASAIAMTTFAMGTAPAASADATVTGNAGITFQTDGNYTYRDITNTAGDHGVFPQQEIGVNGGAYGFSTVSCNDTAINGSGTYTVSIPTSGTIDIEPDLNKPANKKAWWVDEEKGVNRMDSKWSIRGTYEPKEGNEGDPVPPKEEWELQAGNTIFNMLGVSTDIPAYYDKENHKCYLDEALTQEVTVTDVTVDIPGAGTFTGDAGCWKDDVDTLCISLINVYDDTGASNTIDASAFPTEDGDITVTFTINFPGDGDDSADSTESGDSNASGTESGDSNASSSSGSSSSKSGGGNGGGGSNNNGGSTTKSTSTSESLADSASDATENAESGAPAGIALALAAVAGAVVVVSRKK